MTSLIESAAPPRASPSSLVSTTPRERQAVVERGRGLDRVLADHRVDHEQHVLRLDVLVLIVGELLHQRLVDREATGGVVDDRRRT